MTPAHVVEERDAEFTRCGLKRSTKEPRYPLVGAAHVAAHVEGYGLVVCPGCDLSARQLVLW